MAYPPDSWLEDQLFEADLYRLTFEDKLVGYTALKAEIMQFFYVIKDHFRYAPPVFERIINEQQIKRVLAISQDPQLNTLLAEWDYDRKKVACWFTDSCIATRENTRIDDSTFRSAVADDVTTIKQISGDFFDEESGSFHTLEDRIEAGMVFVIENNTAILGIGVIEPGRICTDCISIGMFTNREFRCRGVATAMLLNLKKLVYERNRQPVAGCWYYNTLSRKSLEAAGMVATAIGTETILKSRERLPLRSADPKDEIIE